MKIKLELKLTDRKDGSKMMKRGLAGWMCLALLGTLVCVPGKETAKAASQVTVASLDIQVQRMWNMTRGQPPII